MRGPVCRWAVATLITAIPPDGAAASTRAEQAIAKPSRARSCIDGMERMGRSKDEDQAPTRVKHRQRD
jgi:hypothetical protein